MIFTEHESLQKLLTAGARNEQVLSDHLAGELQKEFSLSFLILADADHRVSQMDMTWKSKISKTRSSKQFDRFLWYMMPHYFSIIYSVLFDSWSKMPIFICGVLLSFLSRYYPYFEGGDPTIKCVHISVLPGSSLLNWIWLCSQNINIILCWETIFLAAKSLILTY